MSRIAATSRMGSECFPRPRGDEPLAGEARELAARVFPARAGMSPYAQRREHQTRGFPRPRGDEPPERGYRARRERFSPPARG